MRNNKFDGKTLLNTVLLGNKSYIILFILIIIMSIASPLFLTTANVMNVVRQCTVTGIATFAFALALGAGCMDMSVGMELLLSGVIAAKMNLMGFPIWITLIVTMLFSAGLGLLNGWLITFFDMPFFIVTLATTSVFQGIAFVITNNVPVSGLSDEMVYLGQGYLFGIPVPIFILVASMLIMWFVVNRTKFGRQALAVGGNAEAARVSGIRVNLIKTEVYALLGLFVGLAAIVQTGRSASAQLSAGTTLTMDCITAAVIGGTNLMGGNASVVGAFAGFLIVGVVSNGLNLLHVSANWQIVADGVMILLAVLVDILSTKLYKRMSMKREA